MIPERWAQIRQTFDSALERTPRDRAAYLAVVCADDDELRREVESLLASHEQSDGFMAQPAANFSATQTLSLSDDDGAEYPEGYRVGPYQLHHCIGRGGMGSVWVAARVDHEYEKKVAVKMVKRGMNSTEILRRFRMERQVLAGLDHPNIARLIDGGSTPDGLPYLVMEYVEGTPIDQYCESHKSSVAERLRLFRAVCSAVQYAHQNLVVHRDIKPGNIMVTPENVPKLLDFGIAKLLHNEVSPMAAAQTGFETRMMTLEYASPEQVRGEPITTAADVYSLGVLLYKLLTGKSPYEAQERSHAAMHYAICEREPRRPSTVVLGDSKGATRDQTQPLEVVGETPEKARKRLKKTLAGDLDMIILKALRKEPQRRYASVEQFSEDIRRYLEGLPVIARRDTLGYRSAKFIRRHAAGVTAATAIGLALIATTVVSYYYARQANRRFQEVRSLARFLLFDFDKAIQDDGPTPTRKLVISKALDYLNRLQQEAGHDLSLQREIMNGYLQVGDVQNNLYHANLGDAAGAADSFQKAFEIANRIYRGRPEDSKARYDVARASAKLGDLQAFGDRKEALHRYTYALTQFETLAAMEGHNLNWQQDVMRVARKIGNIQFEMGDMPSALASYKRALQIAEGMQSIEAASGKPVSADTRRELANCDNHYGETLAKNGAIDEGLAKLDKALDIYRDLLTANPENDRVRHSLISVHQVKGDVLLAAGRSNDAIQSYRLALDLINPRLEADPLNRQWQRDATVGLGRLADALEKSGKRPEAHSTTVRALQKLKPLVEAPDASEVDMQQYCYLLVTTPFTDLQNPAAALRYALKAAMISKESNPGILDTLARAQAKTGDLVHAVETEQKALALLPAGSQSDLRTEIEKNLAEFRRSAANKARPNAASR